MSNFTEFHNQINPRIKVRPMYFELGFSSISKIYGRNELLQRLLNSLEFLPTEFGVLIWDIYRPRAVQARLFDWMKQEIQKQYPHLNTQAIHEETKKYMSEPSKIGEMYCPPHLSGGAIDLTLFNRADEKELEMGSPFDDCTDKAHRDYFNSKDHLTLEEQKIKNHRQILRTAMEKAGFTSYQFEWWHFDYGNLFWGRALKKPALYGPLFGDAEWPG